MDKNYFYLSPEFSDRSFYYGSAEEALSQIVRKIVENNGTIFFIMSPLMEDIRQIHRLYSTFIMRYIIIILNGQEVTM